MKHVRYLPLVLLGATLHLCSPVWDSTSYIVGTAHLYILAGVMCCTGLMIMYTENPFRTGAWVFNLGLLPDIFLTLGSLYLVGDWSFEANAYVATRGSVLIIVPITLGFTGALYLVREYPGGIILMVIKACTRVGALVSHVILWCHIS